MRVFLFSIFFLVCMSFAQEDALASVQVVDSEHFSKMMNDLNAMRSQDNAGNLDFQELLTRASEVSEMYEKCGSINLSDVVDSSCFRFFNIDFPEFEKRYFELTGEMRISSVKASNDLQERREQLSKCSQYLFDNMLEAESFFLPHGEKMNIEPLDDNAVEVSFAFNFAVDVNKTRQLKKLADAWADKCSDIVMNDNGMRFAPYFVKKIKEQNVQNLHKGKNLHIELDSTMLRINVSMNQMAVLKYEVNGKPLFEREFYISDPYFSVNMKDLSGYVANNKMSMDRVDSLRQFADWPSKVVGCWRWTKSSSRMSKTENSWASTVDLSYHPESDDDEVSSGIEGSSNFFGNPMMIGGFATGLISMISFGVGIYSHNQAVNLADAKPNDVQEYKTNRDKIDSYQSTRNIAYVVGGVFLIASGTFFVLSF